MRPVAPLCTRGNPGRGAQAERLPQYQEAILHHTHAEAQLRVWCKLGVVHFIG
jgi:hypothetical protein